MNLKKSVMILLVCVSIVLALEILTPINLVGVVFGQANSNAPWHPLSQVQIDSTLNMGPTYGINVGTSGINVAGSGGIDSGWINVRGALTANSLSLTNPLILNSIGCGASYASRCDGTATTWGNGYIDYADSAGDGPSGTTCGFKYTIKIGSASENRLINVPCKGQVVANANSLDPPTGNCLNVPGYTYYRGEWTYNSVTEKIEMCIKN